MLNKLLNQTLIITYIPVSCTRSLRGVGIISKFFKNFLTHKFAAKVQHYF